MKVIETNSLGQPTGWQQGKNEMYLEKINGKTVYMIIKPLKWNKSGTENNPVCFTENKFREAKKILMEV